MTSSNVTLKIDCYGTYGRASFLADYLEYCAVQGSRITMSMLWDEMQDLGFSRRELSMAREGRNWAEPDEDVQQDEDKLGDQAESVAARVTKIIKERETRLRDRYPFRLDGEGVGAWVEFVRPGTTLSVQPYLALLGIALGHAHAVRVQGLSAASLEDAFEAFLAQILAAAGVPSVVLPTFGDKYEVKIAAAVASLGLEPRASESSHSKWAKDGGTDLVCHLPGVDPRSFPGFVLLGQVTCGKTETWQGKAAEASVAGWRKMLRMDSNPHAFLAVPHHIDSEHWPVLSQDTQVVLVDRLRAVAVCGAISADARLVATSVLGLKCGIP